MDSQGLEKAFLKNDLKISFKTSFQKLHYIDIFQRKSRQ